MMTSILLLLGAAIALMISRIHRSAKVYMSLLLMLMLGFILGSSVKSAVANVPNTTNKEVVTTIPSPTLQSTSDVTMETEDSTLFVTSQDTLGSEMVVTDSEGEPKELSLKPEIQNDS